MLAAGMSAPHALEAINTILRSAASECSVSLDLICIDTVSGEASIYKSGAAPTYLRRGGKVFPIDAPGVPIGILSEPELTRSDFTIRAGDLLLFSSDGVDADGSVADGRSVWLFDVIESDLSEADMATRAVRTARQSGSRDDISVIVLKINAEAE
jgi:stage II sporulation protein E